MDVLPRGGRRRLIVVCPGVVEFDDVAKGKMKMAGPSSSARPPGRVVVRKMREMIPAPEVARTSTRKWYKNEGMSVGHSVAVMGSGKLTFQSCKVHEKCNRTPKPLIQIFRKFVDLFFGVFEANCDVGKYPSPKGGSGGASKEVSDMVKNNFDSPYLRKESSVLKTL